MPRILLSDIAAHLHTAWRGDPTASVCGVAPLADARDSDISLYADSRYRRAAIASRAGAILVRPGRSVVPADRSLVVDDPFEALSEVVGLLVPEPGLAPGVHPTADVEGTAKVDLTARIEAFASVGARSVVGARTVVATGACIGADVEIGDHTRVGPNAVVMDGIALGRRVRIGPGAVIGAVGFGFTAKEGTWRRVRHVGTVVIGDDVEIGANCTVDRGTLGATKIGRGTKLDNLVHVGHNVEIGEDVVIAAQCGLSGSASLGDGVLVGGQAGVGDHVVIAAGTRVAAKAGVMKSFGARGGTAGAVTIAGHPARPLVEQRRAEASLRSLDEMRRRLHDVERLLAGLRHGGAA